MGEGAGQRRVTEEWWLDEAGRQVIGERGLVELSDLEFRLLRHFLAHDGAVLSRAQLLDAVCGTDYSGSDRAVDQQVYLLRRALEPDPARRRLPVLGAARPQMPP